MRITSSFLASTRIPAIQMVKSILAISLAWGLSVLLLGEYMPIFAAIAALLIVAPSVNESFEKGIERSLGVITGVLFASLISLALPVTGWVVLVTVAVSIAVSWASRFSTGMTNQVVISSMLALALGAGTVEFALLRTAETAIGAGAAIGLNLLLAPPVLVEPAREKINILGGEVSNSLLRLAHALEHKQRPEDLHGVLLEARLMRPMVDAADTAMVKARESLTLNPRAHRFQTQLAEMDELLDTRLRGTVVEVVGMTRAFFDHYDDELHTEPMVSDIAEQLRRAAHDVRLLVRLAEVDPTPMTSAIPALTAPLQLRAPSGQRWILIGSLMEDLRRIHERLSGIET